MSKSVRPAKPVKVAQHGKQIKVVVSVDADELVQYTPTQMDTLAAAVDSLAHALSRLDEEVDEEHA